MTNKIEVPRRLLERIAYWLKGSVTVGGANAGETYNELRALLVTPEAPRQNLQDRLIDSEKLAAHYQSLFQEMLDCLDARTVNAATIKYLDQINSALQHPAEQTSSALAANESLEFYKWWSATEILKKSKLQVAQEAWQARSMTANPKS